MADPLLRPLWRSQDGRVIHLNDCPYSAGSLRWKYADSLDDFGVWVAMDKYHWLRWCGHCRNRHSEVIPATDSDDR